MWRRTGASAERTCLKVEEPAVEFSDAHSARRTHPCIARLRIASESDVARWCTLVCVEVWAVAGEIPGKSRGATVNVRFGAFQFDTDRRQLRRDGEEVHLTPKAFDLLALL